MALKVPARLAESCGKTGARAEWLGRLPRTLRELEQRWSLTLGEPCDEGSCAWVAPVTLPGGVRAVLKVGMPHMEAAHEIEGLRFWDGDPTVRLLMADRGLGAMILERCEPGDPLRQLPEREQDTVVSALLRRLWRVPAEPHPFRPLSDLMQHWRAETLRDVNRWPDPGLVREGLRLFDELSRTAQTGVLLATDLHAGNILRSQREPWLVIDPKPFLGDPAYDATQHLFNCRARMRSDPGGTIRRIADLLGLNRERVRLWTFARAAAEPRETWQADGLLAAARALAP